MEGNNTEFQRPEFQEPIDKPQLSQQENLKPESQSLEAAEAGRLRRLKVRFNKVFSKEQRQGEPFPKISIDIFFSPHDTSRDIKGFENKFKKADIYIPEVFGWDWSLEQYRDISDGRIDPKVISEGNKKFSNTFSYKEMQIVYNSHKPITIIDVPSLHPLEDRYRELQSYNPFAGDFSEALDSIKNEFKKGAEAHGEREQYMLSELRPKIKDLLEIYPSLKHKKELRVLLSLGIFHTPIFHNLRKSYQTVAREFGSMSNRYPFFVEGGIRVMFGKEIDDELAAKAFLEPILDNTTSFALPVILRSETTKDL